jgi:hypothetical protein
MKEDKIDWDKVWQDGDTVDNEKIGENDDNLDEDEELEFMEDGKDELKEKELTQKYNAVNLEDYDSGYTSGIQKLVKEKKVVLFRGSVDDIFSLKNNKYIKISTSFYENEYSGNIEINEEWENFFMANNSDDDLVFDPFYFLVKLTNVDLITGGKEGSDKNIFLEGNLVYVEKVLVE